MHDFLLAATILSILVLQATNGPKVGLGGNVAPDQTQERMISALQKSYTIWKQTQDISSDTKKAFVFIRSIMEKIELANGPASNSQSALPLDNQSTADVNASTNPISELSIRGM